MKQLMNLPPSLLNGATITKLALVSVQMSCLKISLIKARMRLSSAPA